MSDNHKDTVHLCTEVIPKTDSDAIHAALNEFDGNRVQIDQGGLANGTTNDQVREALALLTGKRWDNGRTLKVWFDPAGDAYVDRVKKYFLVWTEFANISFSWVKDRNTAEIRVGFVEGDGSWSYMGTDNLTIPKDEYTMNLGWLSTSESEDEFSRVVTHEVGHALGAIHEHQSPGGGGVPWDRQAVIDYYSGPPNRWSVETIESNIFYRYSESQSNFTDFDPHSIMAYAIPNNLTIGDFYVPWNIELSDQDKEFISWMYPKTVVSPPPPPPPPPPAKLPTKTLTRFVANGVKERTGITKSGKKFAIAEPWNS